MFHINCLAKTNNTTILTYQDNLYTNTTSEL